MIMRSGFAIPGDLKGILAGRGGEKGPRMPSFGTTRTRRDVRVAVAIGGKADLQQNP